MANANKRNEKKKIAITIPPSKRARTYTIQTKYNGFWNLEPLNKTKCGMMMETKENFDNKIGHFLGWFANLSAVHVFNNQIKCFIAISGGRN